MHTPLHAPPSLPTGRITARTFYTFLGVHSLLIGLLPFFIPVFLWTEGYGLLGVVIAVAATGASFAMSLRIWEKLARAWPVARLFALTLLLDVFIVAVLTFLVGHAWLAVAIGIASGIYNAFFWTTQRTLFAQLLGSNDSGRQYGNFQIFVTIILKIGILTGGWLLENQSLHTLLWVSAGIVTVAIIALYLLATPSVITHDIPNPLRASFRYTDDVGSRRIFMLDGIFLFLESHLWTLSLFLVVREDYSRLGIAVVVLALVFTVLFWILKNSIDHLPLDRMFRVTVGLYAMGWLLRAWLDADMRMDLLLALLVIITFCSSLFRLAFNKRFFDHALAAGTLPYLLSKSYLSQVGIALAYSVLALVLWQFSVDALSALTGIYLVASVVSLGYLGYRRPPAR